MNYRCSACGKPTTPILCSVGVSGECCPEAPLLVVEEQPVYERTCPAGVCKVPNGYPCICIKEANNMFIKTARPLTAFEEDELKRELWDDLPRASQRAIARGDAS